MPKIRISKLTTIPYLKSFYKINTSNSIIGTIRTDSKKNKTTENYINLYSQKIISLQNMLKSLNLEKEQFLQENAKLNIEIKTNKTNNIDKEYQEKEKKLKEEFSLNKIKKEIDNKDNEMNTEYKSNCDKLKKR